MVDLADIVRIILWPGMLYLIIRMGWRAGVRDADGVTSSMLLARAALAVLFISRSILMAENWHQPLNPVVTVGTIGAMVLVWVAKDL